LVHASLAVVPHATDVNAAQEAAISYAVYRLMKHRFAKSPRAELLFEDLDYFIPLGKAKVVRPGSAFTVLAYSAMTPLAIQAADEMGVDAEVIDLRSLDRAGLDWETIGASVRKTNNVVMLEQGPLTASYGAMVTDEVQRRFFDDLDQPVVRIHGGESSPSVSKVLERAAFVGLEEIHVGFARVLADSGRAPPPDRTA
jgi:2-oxoisovalerate dehydrogenase E1 component